MRAHLCRILLCAAASAMAVLFTAGAAWGAVRYASPDGDGALPCVQADPCSLDAALTVPGDSTMTEVALTAGDYVRTTPLIVNNPREIHGPAPGEGVARLRFDLSALGNGLDLSGEGSIVRDLTVEASNAIYAVSLQRAATLERMRIVSTGSPSGGLIVRDGTLVRDTAIQAQEGLGIAVVLALAGDDPVDVVNVTALSDQVAGLRVMRSLADDGRVRVVNSVVRGAGGSASDIEVLDAGAGITVQFDVSHSNYGSLSCDPTVTCTEGAGNQAGAPLLDAALRQQDGSPTIDAGFATPAAGLGAFDVDGEVRVQGAAVDIGADEHAPPPAPPAAGGGGSSPTVPPPAPAPAPPAAPALAPPPAAGPPPVVPDRVAPRISRLSIGRPSFAPRRPAALRVTVDEAATVRVALRRVQTGRRAGARCVAARRLPPRGRRCRRTVAVRTALRARALPGRRARIRLPRGLRPGRYRAVVTARDAAGNRSAARRIGFRVARRR